VPNSDSQYDYYEEEEESALAVAPIGAAPAPSGDDYEYGAYEYSLYDGKTGTDQAKGLLAEFRALPKTPK